MYLEVSHVQDGHVALRRNTAAVHLLCKSVWLKPCDLLRGVRQREERADVQQGSEGVHLYTDRGE